MCGSAPSPPPAPDPAKTAAAQAAANKEAAISQAQINMINQQTPFGSLEYTQRGTAPDGTPQYTATQTLSPEQQQMLDLTNQAGIKFGQTANQQLGAVSERLAQPLDFSSLGPAPEVNEETRQATAQAMFDRLNPQFDRDRQALETRLANQGITDVNSQAYQDAVDELARARNDARLAVQSQAGNEMARLFGLESTARNQGINEMVQQRQIPLNELAAMLSGTQVQSPSFVNVPQTQINPADIMGATYASNNAAQQNYAQQMANERANRQGLYSLLGTGAQAAFYFSDRRLKRDIRRIGKLANGLAVYAFRYIWGDQETVGLMADEVKKVRPHAVVTIAGFDAVNYAEAVR